MKSLMPINPSWRVPCVNHPSLDATVAQYEDLDAVFDVDDNRMVRPHVRECIGAFCSEACADGRPDGPLDGVIAGVISGLLRDGLERITPDAHIGAKEKP